MDPLGVLGEAGEVDVHRPLSVLVVSPGPENRPLRFWFGRLVGRQVIVPSGHRLAQRRKLRPSDLKSQALVVPPIGSSHRSMLTQLLRTEGCDLQVSVEATGWELMLHFAKLGVGLAVVNDFCPVPAGMLGIPLKGAPSIDYYLVRRPGLPHRGASALRRLIAETADSGTGALAPQ